MTENATTMRNAIGSRPVLVVLLVLFLLFSVGIVIVIGLALGLGYCLSTLIPAIELAQATMIALLAQLMVLFFGLKLIASVASGFSYRNQEAMPQHDESDDNDFASEVAEQMVEVMLAKSELYQPIRVTPKNRKRRQTA